MAKNEASGDPFEQAFLNAYPNPQRIGCPGDEITRKIARKHLPIDHPALEHVAQCSPCFRDVKAFQAEWAHVRARVRTGAVAAVVAILSAGSVYMMLRRPWEPNPPTIAHSKPSVSSKAAAPLPSSQAAVLNFETLSSVRGVSPSQNQPAELQRLPRSPLSLSIYLPKGSEPGDYEVKLLKARSDDAGLIQATGTARIEDGLTVLLVAIDFSQFEPGTYVIAFRRESGAWHYSSVALS